MLVDFGLCDWCNEYFGEIVEIGYVDEYVYGDFYWLEFVLVGQQDGVGCECYYEYFGEGWQVEQQ